MAVSFPESGSTPQAPRMKSFIMFRCGHKFHNGCISEKIQLDYAMAGKFDEEKDK